MSDAPVTQPPAEAPLPPNYFWPTLIISLIVGHVLAVSVMVYVATRDPSFAVEPDYYDQALKYEQTIRQRQVNVDLGWTAKLVVGPPQGVLNERLITCRLGDAKGQSVEHATIDVVAFHHRHGNDRAHFVLLPEDDGMYRAKLRTPYTGTWEFRLVIARGKDTFTQRELVDIE